MADPLWLRSHGATCVTPSEQLGRVGKARCANLEREIPFPLKAFHELPSEKLHEKSSA